VSAAVSITVDPDGRRVSLLDNQWRHIKEEHGRLSPHLREIMAAVREPDRHVEGRRPGEEWFYAAGAGPDAWLKVVVDYEHGHGTIATAFPRSRFP
jgi:hypothetical protein